MSKFPSLMCIWTWFLLFSTYHCGSIVHGGEIVSLTDSNFEHDTQASTGSTTGSWFILFKASQCPHCKALQPSFDRLSQDEEIIEAGIVLATIDVPSNRKTSTRFEIRGFPTMIFLHKGNVYTFKGKREFDALKAFLLGGYADDPNHQYNVRPIPPPPTALQVIMKTIKAVGLELKDAASGKSGPAGFAMITLIAIVLVILVMFIGFVLTLFVPAKTKKQTASLQTKKRT